MVRDQKKLYEILFITIFLFFFNINSLYSKSFTDNVSNFGIGLGLGYNQLFSETRYGDVDRKDFSLKPSIRICYKHNLIYKINFYSFLGYYEFGGKRKKDGIYKGDEIWLKSLEFGSSFNYNIKFIKFGVGAKLNKILEVKEKYYDVNVNEYKKRCWTNYYKNYSINLGFILSLTYSHFNLLFESWYGITNLLKNNPETTERENHFRIIFGYWF